MQASQQVVRRRSWTLKILAFCGGMVTLTIEFAASRLLGASFGVSNVVWVAIISLILLYLAVGYFVGGRWADRRPELAVLLQIGAWAGLISSFIPIVAQRMIPLLVELKLPLAAGALIAVALLYAVPIILLGCISPFAIRLAVYSLKDAGQVTGSLFAYGTLGSMFGSVVPVLYLLPVLGTRLTFFLAGGVLLVVSLGALLLERPVASIRMLWMPCLYVFLILVM